MKTDTHTQGEWEASGCTIYSGETILAVAYCEGNRSLHNLHEKDTPPNSDGEEHGKGWEEAWANARLIAAAPDLLAALESLAVGLSPASVDMQWENLADLCRVCREIAESAISKAKGGNA